jgi:hypothetical protein
MTEKQSDEWLAGYTRGKVVEREVCIDIMQTLIIRLSVSSTSTVSDIAEIRQALWEMQERG